MLTKEEIKELCAIRQRDRELSAKLTQSDVGTKFDTKTYHVYIGEYTSYSYSSDFRGHMENLYIIERVKNKLIPQKKMYIRFTKKTAN